MSNPQVIRPKPLRYEDGLPLFVRSRRSRQIYRPTHSGKFNAKSNNKINLQITGDHFLNQRNSVLQFDVTLTEGMKKDGSKMNDTDRVKLDGSAHSLIKQIIVRAGSIELERINGLFSTRNNRNKILKTIQWNKTYKGRYVIPNFCKS